MLASGMLRILRLNKNPSNLLSTTINTTSPTYQSTFYYSSSYKRLFQQPSSQPQQRPFNTQQGSPPHDHPVSTSWHERKKEYSTEFQEGFKKGWGKMGEELPKYLCLGISAAVIGFLIDQLLKHRSEKFSLFKDAKEAANKEYASNYKFLANSDVGQTLSRLQLFTDEKHSDEERRKMNAELLQKIIKIEMLQKRAYELSSVWVTGIGLGLKTFQNDLIFQKHTLIIGYKINTALLDYQNGNYISAYKEINLAIQRFYHFTIWLDSNQNYAKGLKIRLNEIVCSMFNNRGLIERSLAQNQTEESERLKYLSFSYHSYTIAITKFNPNDAIVYHNRGFLIAEDMGELQLGLEDQQKANSLKRGDASIINGLAYIHHQMFYLNQDLSELDTAEGLYNRALEISNNKNNNLSSSKINPVILRNLAHLYIDQKKYELALHKLEEAITHLPHNYATSALYYYYVGICQAGLGNPEEANQALNKAKTYSYGLSQLKYKINLAIEQIKKEKSFFNRTIQISPTIEKYSRNKTNIELIKNMRDDDIYILAENISHKITNKENIFKSDVPSFILMS